METLTFQPILGPIVMTLIAVLSIAMLFIGPSFAKLEGNKRLTLSLIRLGVIGLAFLTLLRPGCVQTLQKNQAASLVVSLDISRSMELPHITDDSTRWKVASDMLQQNASRFKQLMDNQVEIKFRSFDGRVQPLDWVDGQLQLPEKPTGSETDIGTPIYTGSLEVRDRPLLGMIIISDFVQNALEPEIEMIDAVESLAAKEAPLIAVQLGTPGDSGQLADIAITTFAEQQVVNKKSDLVANATLVARGFANQDIEVELVISDGVTDEVVTSEIVRPSKSYEEMTVRLKHRPTEPGEFRITVRAKPMPGEVAIRNNSLDGFLTVRDEGMRVLFLSGGLNYEQRVLRDSLPALQFLDMTFRPIYTDNASRRSWPLNDLTAEFADPKKYDVFILSNVDSRALYDHERKVGPLVALAEAVKSGKGLLMLGGTHSFDPGMYGQTPLRDILPIKMDPRARQEFNADVDVNYHVTQPFSLQPTVNNFLTRISESGANREAWRELPPLVGANRLLPKSTSEVFLESDDDTRRPILVAANVGSGRVLAFAGDSTWRWLRVGKKTEFDLFWRQLVLWLGFWDSKNDESLSIDFPRRRFPPKPRLKFGVNVRTITGETIDGAEFDAKIILPNGVSEPITITRAGDRYECQVEPERLKTAGVYRVQVSASHQGEAIGTAEREFVVVDQDKEKSNPAANPELSSRLANETSDFGGKAIAPEQLSDLLDEMIKNPRMKKIEIPTKWRIGETMFDATGFLLAFVGLLTVEWFLRKKWGLV